MFRKFIVFGLLVASGLLIAPSDAQAVYINGKWVTKGVECTGNAIVKNVDNNPVTIACSVEILPTTNNENVILVCRNPTGKLSYGRAFVNTNSFPTALTVPRITDLDKGKTEFNAILNGSGIVPEYVEACKDEGQTLQCRCDNTPTCVTLRDSCPNANWTPIDVVPLKMKATAASYYNGNSTGACDPNKLPPDPNACASATCNGNPPWSLLLTDYNFVGGVYTPKALATEVSTCTLPNPKTWRFDDKREYNCTVTTDTSCQ